MTYAQQRRASGKETYQPSADNPEPKERSAYLNIALDFFAPSAPDLSQDPTKPCYCGSRFQSDSARHRWARGRVLEEAMAERETEREFDYLVQRACEEREIAAGSGERTAALIHRKLAAEYERRAGRRIMAE